MPRNQTKPARVPLPPGEVGRHRNRGRDRDRAVQDLVQRLGPDYVAFAAAGGSVYVWDAGSGHAGPELDPDGDTIIHGRRAFGGDPTDQNMLHHLLGPLDLSGRAGLRPRMVVMAAGLSGCLDYDNRVDLHLGAAAIEAGWVNNVVWRGGDRIAREVVVAETYYRQLESSHVGLWFSEWGRKVSGHADMTQLRVATVMGSNEASRARGSSRAHSVPR